jgi:hypothetical protein
MHLLISGEGASDIGVCNHSLSICQKDNFVKGPMAIVIDKLIEHYLEYEYSHLEYDNFTFVSERFLADEKLNVLKKPRHLRGKKKPPETQYFFQNARVLAKKAKQLAEEKDENVVAVLFRDSDGTASAGRGLWADKVASMLKGFEAEDYSDLGVPMIPKPKSEAWLLCALKENPYQTCDRLEYLSGNDNSPNSLKLKLSEVLDDTSSLQLNQMIERNVIDIQSIDMPSFNAFKSKLQQAILIART